MRHDYEKDLEVIEAVTAGPWACKYNDARNGFGNPFYFVFGVRAEYIAHFNPPYTKQLVEKAMERDALAEENEALTKRVGELIQAISKAVNQLKDAEPCMAKSKAYGILMEELLR